MLRLTNISNLYLLIELSWIVVISFILINIEVRPVNFDKGESVTNPEYFPRKVSSEKVNTENKAH